MEERRRFIRVDLSPIEVRCQAVGQDDVTIFHVMKDLSQGGIRFFVNERFSPGTMLELELVLPDEASPIQAQAEVVWCARVQGHGPHEVGCRFTQIDPVDRGKLIRLVHETLTQRKPFVR